MTATDDAFTRNIARWKAEQQTPWSQLKYRLAVDNLNKHLTSPPQRILDAGGGNGVEALQLARAGYHITLVDSSAAMLDEARQVFSAAGLATRCTIYQRDLTDLGDLFLEHDFDVIICHNVLQYVPDAAQLLKTLSDLLKADGMLSLMSVNRYSAPYQAAFLHHDLERAYQSLDDRMQRATVFDASMNLYTAEEISQLLAAQGFSAIHHYGVRCICDYWGDNAL
jgi:S-adenosylmethionine-dependent methyltransferase